MGAKMTSLWAIIFLTSATSRWDNNPIGNSWFLQLSLIPFKVFHGATFDSNRRKIPHFFDVTS